MDQRFFHGELSASDFAQSLLAEFNRGNLRTQVLGQPDNLAVQIGTKPGAASGGKTAVTVTIQKSPDGVLIRLGGQELLGTAASLGQTTISALVNPWNLLGRLDDIAQDVENLQLTEHVWRVIDDAARAMGASHSLSERLSRLTCDFCGTANQVGQAACIACGAPMGKSQPSTCPNCGYVVAVDEKTCPNCDQPL